jgi:hypothetical protein
LSFFMTILANSPRARCHTRLHRPLRQRNAPDGHLLQRIRQAIAYTSQSTGCTYVGTDTRQDIVRHAYTLVSQGHARTAAQARIQTSCARAVAAASTRHLTIGHQPVCQQNNTKGSRTPAQRAQMGSPPSADTRTNVLQQTRAVRGAGAALPRCLGPRSADLHQPCHIGSKSGRERHSYAASQRPITCTMVLGRVTRGSRVRCAPRQGRPGRAARAAGRRTRSLPNSLPDSLPDFRKGALARIFRPKNI